MKEERKPCLEAGKAVGYLAEGWCRGLATSWFLVKWLLFAAFVSVFAWSMVGANDSDYAIIDTVPYKLKVIFRMS